MLTDANQGDAVAGASLAVACRNVVKTYGSGAASVAALRGVDLEVRKGELFMLVGPSGCGKTTLISVVAAILDPDDGRCEVLGRDLGDMGPRDKIRFRGRSIGLVFQLFNLLPALSAVENVSLPLLLNGFPRQDAEDAARTMLDSVGLGERLDAVPARLSGGEQQRVAVARALVHEPELVICDEPTSNLDHATGQNVMRTLRAIATGPDRALVVVTHDTRILGFADRIARMEDGRIVETVAGERRPA
jgi:putative ABC transport system ATP-binding protein